jgi:hypothetical protein
MLFQWVLWEVCVGGEMLEDPHFASMEGLFVTIVPN